MEIGDTVYYLKSEKEGGFIKSKTIQEAKVVGSDISSVTKRSDGTYEGGYLMYRIKPNHGNPVLIESAHVHPTVGDAEAHLSIVGPIMDEAETLERETISKYKELREKVIGKPPFTELAKEVAGVE